MSDSVWPQRRQPTRLPLPWDSPARTLEWVAISFSNAWKGKVKWSLSVVSDSSHSQGLQPTRLLRPWDFPGKSTGVGRPCLLHVWYWMVTNISNHLYTQRLEIRHTSLNTIMHTLIHQRGCEPQVSLILQTFSETILPTVLCCLGNKIYMCMEKSYCLSTRIFKKGLSCWLWLRL